MATKSKNSNKLAVFIIICTILVPTYYILGQYSGYYRDYSENRESEYASILNSQEFLEHFLDMSFILYSLEAGENEEAAREILSESYGELTDSYRYFEGIYPYLDYMVEDQEGKVTGRSTANMGEGLTKGNLEDYSFGLAISYDSAGNPDVRQIFGEFRKNQSMTFRRLIGSTGNAWQRVLEEGEMYDLERPKNRTFYYGITEQNLKQYLAQEYNLEEYYDVSELSNTAGFLILVVAVLAWAYPFLPFWRIGEARLFQAPFEAAVLVFSTGLLLITDGGNLEWLIARGRGAAGFIDGVCWGSLFALAYWASSCLRQVYVLGPRAYVRERTILYPSRLYIKRAWTFVKDKAAAWLKKAYHSLEEVDLRENGNKLILKIVLCNFLLLAAMCFMWFFGVFALCIYSVILFFLLRKYYRDLREKYQVLLNATNQIAEGNLEVEITEDLGIFTPFRTEIDKIQTGFRKAVEEEVKSQRMKTDLVTNVSHDLKTPLTAIITYVNLLKDEKDEEKRKDYIQVLENKSLRLKVLIEDLFEISKASSRNITLHIVDVDIVNLFKQVKLELEDKLSEASVEFRCSYPEEKLTVPLDSQKTYRIFENLLVNVSKYAMPHTRAYVEIKREGEEAVVRIKNVSASELRFNPEEITERFVRGDLSRNTEGSGLGLAIVESFTKLQKGKFKIETEADLFKAEIRFWISVNTPAQQKASENLCREPF